MVCDIIVTVHHVAVRDVAGRDVAVHDVTVHHVVVRDVVVRDVVVMCSNTQTWSRYENSRYTQSTPSFLHIYENCNGTHMA